MKKPSSPDYADMRFSSGAMTTRRGEELHTGATLPRKSVTPARIAVARSNKSER